MYLGLVFELLLCRYFVQAFCASIPYIKIPIYPLHMAVGSALTKVDPEDF